MILGVLAKCVCVCLFFKSIFYSEEWRLQCVLLVGIDLVLKSVKNASVGVSTAA